MIKLIFERPLPLCWSRENFSACSWCPPSPVSPLPARCGWGLTGSSGPGCRYRSVRWSAVRRWNTCRRKSTARLKHLKTDQKNFQRWDAAIAQWIRLSLPFCRPGFECQAHHVCFFQFISYKLYIFHLNWNVKRTKINKKSPRLVHLK